jgi:hypothetical protein
MTTLATVTAISRLTVAYTLPDTPLYYSILQQHE